MTTESIPNDAAQCIFSGKLNHLADSLPIPVTYADAQTTAQALYVVLEPIDRYFPRYYERDGLTSVLSAAMYESMPPQFDCTVWYARLIEALRNHAATLDFCVRYAYQPALLTEIVNDVNPIPWADYIESVEMIVSDGQGVTLYASSNCGYVTVHGFVFRAVGFHMFNLYNRFAAARYNWNHLPE